MKQQSTVEASSASGTRGGDQDLIDMANQQRDQTVERRGEKDLSPGILQHEPAKGAAFMRSTEDSNLHTMIPQMEQINLYDNNKLFGGSD